MAIKLPPPAEVFSEAELQAKQNLIISELESVLEKAVTELKDQKIDAVYNYEVNNDGTIDAELRVRTIPRNMSVPMVITRMEENLTAIDNTWTDAGFLFDPKSDDTPYQKIGGYNMVQTNYQEASKFHYNFANARLLPGNLRGANRGQIRQIFYRIHWNSMIGRPKRE